MDDRPRLQQPHLQTVSSLLHLSEVRLRNPRPVNHAIAPPTGHTTQRAAWHRRHRRRRPTIKRKRILERRARVDVEARRDVDGKLGAGRAAEGVEVVNGGRARSGCLRTRGDGQERQAAVGASVVGDGFERCAATRGAGREALHFHGDGAVGLDVAFEVGGDGDLVQREVQLHRGARFGRYADAGGAAAFGGGAPVDVDDGADGGCAGWVGDCALAGRDFDVGRGCADGEVYSAGAAGVDVDCTVLWGVRIHAH